MTFVPKFYSFLEMHPYILDTNWSCLNTSLSLQKNDKRKTRKILNVKVLCGVISYVIFAHK